jgi:hypothetical protein
MAQVMNPKVLDPWGILRPSPYPCSRMDRSRGIEPGNTRESSRRRRTLARCASGSRASPISGTRRLSPFLVSRSRMLPVRRSTSAHVSFSNSPRRERRSPGSGARTARARTTGPSRRLRADAGDRRRAGIGRKGGVLVALADAGRRVVRDAEPSRTDGDVKKQCLSRFGSDSGSRESACGRSLSP